MNTVQQRFIKRTIIETDIDKLLDTTISQHGYWLINHKDIILEWLESLLSIYGFKTAVQLLNDINSKAVVDIYARIKEVKG